MMEGTETDRSRLRTRALPTQHWQSTMLAEIGPRSYACSLPENIYPFTLVEIWKVQREHFFTVNYPIRWSRM